MAKYTESIIQKDDDCFNCGRKGNPRNEIHHCIKGTSGRKLSEKFGLKVSLCPECHRGTYGVHGREGKDLDRWLKKIAQTSFEREYSHEEWMRIFGRNYL